MDEIEITTPILLIGFNRPGDIQQSFGAIRKVKPTKLYVAIDGPRKNRIHETEKVEEVRNIVSNIDWKCDVHYRFSNENLGCKGNIPSAISWVLENEDRVIVVEDDIVAPPSFFVFEQEMLEKYKDDERIAMVSGNNYTPISMNEDYLFSLYAGHIWGWGTWKRIWDQFDVNTPMLSQDATSNFESIRRFTSCKQDVKYFSRYFYELYEKQNNGLDNFWGPQFLYFRLSNQYLNIVPKVNLASNIGCISSRDTGNNSKGEFYYPSEPLFRVKISPLSVSQNKQYDKYHLRHHLDRRMNINKIPCFFKSCYVILKNFFQERNK